MTGSHERATRNPCGEAGRRCCSGARLSRSRCWLSLPRLISMTPRMDATTRACCATSTVRRSSLPALTTVPIRRPQAPLTPRRRDMPATRSSRGTGRGRRPPDDSSASLASRFRGSTRPWRVGVSIFPSEGGAPGPTNRGFLSRIHERSCADRCPVRVYGSCPEPRARSAGAVQALWRRGGCRQPRSPRRSVGDLLSAGPERRRQDHQHSPVSGVPGADGRERARDGPRRRGRAPGVQAAAWPTSPSR